MKGKASCIKQPKCSDDFLIDYKNNKCLNGFTDHTFKYDKNLKCDNSTQYNEYSLQVPCSGCPKGYYQNDDKVCLPCKNE
jgi:hypothetical protein